MQIILQPKTKSDYHHIMRPVFRLIVLVLSWISKILPQTNFLQRMYYISPTRLMNFLQMHVRLLTISKMQCKSNNLYLKMTLFLSGDINLNPGPVSIC